MPVVSVTRLRLRALRFLPIFMLHAIRASRQASASAGFLGGWTGREPGLGFWTATVWHSLDDARAFRNAEPHLGSMRKLLDWCDETAYVHWEQDGTHVVDASTAHARMTEGGKTSKVRYPSARHRAGTAAGDSIPRITQRLRGASATG